MVPVRPQHELVEELPRRRLWDGDTDELREHVSRYLCALPRDAKFNGIKLDQNKVPIEASLVKAAPTLVMVQVELE